MISTAVDASIPSWEGNVLAAGSDECICALYLFGPAFKSLYTPPDDLGKRASTEVAFGYKSQKVDVTFAQSGPVYVYL